MTTHASTLDLTPSFSVKAVLWKLRGVIFLAAVAFVLYVLTDGTFLTSRNLTNLCRQVAINGILAVGMTFVILLGGIDLSIGSVVALSGVIAGLLQVQGGFAQWTGTMAWIGTMLSIAAAVGSGWVLGSVNATVITRYRITPFIMTLGTMVIARGLALILSGGAAVAPLGDAFNTLGQGYLPVSASFGLVVGCCLVLMMVLWKAWRESIPAVIPRFTAVLLVVGGALAALYYIFVGYQGMPVPVLILCAIALMGAMTLGRTRFGRYVLAIGGNPDAAWLSGVPVRSTVFRVYAAMGALAGLSGAILSARLNGSLPTAGELFELDAIAAVVIGGTSLQGGIGTVWGSILGAFFIGALNNGMSLLDVSEFYQKIIKGLIIILAVLLDAKYNKKE